MRRAGIELAHRAIFRLFVAVTLSLAEGRASVWMIRRIGIAALIAALLLLVVLAWPFDTGNFFIRLVLVTTVAPPVLATIFVWLLIEIVYFIRARFFP